MSVDVRVECLLEIWEGLSSDDRKRLIDAAEDIIAHSGQCQSSVSEPYLLGSSCPKG